MALIPMQNNLSRRFVLGSGVAFCAAPAFALNSTQAKSLVDRVVGEINRIIGSGQSEARMIKDFKSVFARYADLNAISGSVVGPPWRSATNAQKRAFQKAFTNYMGVKYGRRFREFIGGQIVVQKAEPWKSHFQVFTESHIPGQAPFSVIFRVSDRSGKDLFFDMLIEGISLLKTEAVEVRAMIDANGRSLSRTITMLQNYG